MERMKVKKLSEDAIIPMRWNKTDQFDALETVFIIEAFPQPSKHTEHLQ